jgi:hypothetical protein
MRFIANRKFVFQECVRGSVLFVSAEDATWSLLDLNSTVCFCVLKGSCGPAMNVIAAVLFL